MSLLLESDQIPFSTVEVRVAAKAIATNAERTSHVPTVRRGKSQVVFNGPKALRAREASNEQPTSRCNSTNKSGQDDERNADASIE
jgi:hypothetical protein